MLRYLAMVWDAHDPEQRRAASMLSAETIRDPAWTVVFEGRGMAVACRQANPDDYNVLPVRAGIVLGTLFSNEKTAMDGTAYARASLTAEDAARAVRSGGRSLVENNWGSYIAFLCDEGNERNWVVRAPLGLLPCYKASYKGVTLFFRTLEDCVGIPDLQFPIDWEYVAAFLVLSRPQYAKTGTQGVEELQAGMALELSRAGARQHVYWDPTAIVRDSVIEDKPVARKALREETRACVRAWASLHSNIVMRLSGGLDSSIMLSCLADTPGRPGITCLNHYTEGPRADERSFARLMANHAGVPLQEWERDETFSWESLLEHPPTVSPFGYLTHLENTPFDGALCRETGSTGIFIGTHGDTLFHYGPAVPAATEYLSRHGLAPSFFRMALHVAQHERLSLLDVVRKAIEDSRSQRPRGLWVPEELRSVTGSLVRDEIENLLKRDAARFVHPWLHAVDGVPFGKLFQISLLSADSILDDPLLQDFHPQPTHPFFSQPLATLCLRIPTYILTHSAWDRALARSAFERDLPRQIATRTTKGSPSAWERRIIARNAGFIRDVLLDGVLVRERLLDKQKLERAMPGNVAKISTPIARIIDYLCAEIWARAANRPSLRAAA